MQNPLQVILTFLHLQVQFSCFCRTSVTLTLLNLLKGSRGATPDLSSKQGRQQWEKLVCESAISSVLRVRNTLNISGNKTTSIFIFPPPACFQDLQRKLDRAVESIRADDGLAGSPLMNLLHGDPGKMLSLPSNCPTHCSSFWTFPEIMTVQRFSQLVDTAPGRTALPLLSMFLKKVPGHSGGIEPVCEVWC